MQSTLFAIGEASYGVTATVAVGVRFLRAIGVRLKGARRSPRNCKGNNPPAEGPWSQRDVQSGLRTGLGMPNGEVGRELGNCTDRVVTDQTARTGLQNAKLTIERNVVCTLDNGRWSLQGGASRSEALWLAALGEGREGKLVHLLDRRQKRAALLLPITRV